MTAGSTTGVALLAGSDTCGAAASTGAAATVSAASASGGVWARGLPIRPVIAAMPVPDSAITATAAAAISG